MSNITKLIPELPQNIQGLIKSIEIFEPEKIIVIMRKGLEKRTNYIMDYENPVQVSDIIGILEEAKMDVWARKE